MTRIGLLACVCLGWASVVYAGDSSSYEVKGSADIADGKRGKASVIVTAKPGWHLNEKAPVTLAVTPPAGVVVRKKKLVRKDLTIDTREEARFDIPLTFKTAGARTMTVEANFVICKVELCTPQTEQLTIGLN